MLMQRRMAAKKKGKKLKTMRCHVKDGHLRCQAKKPMTKTDTATFYKTMFGLGEEGTETEPVEEDVEEEEVLVEALRAAPERQQKSGLKKRKERKTKKEKKKKSAVKNVRNEEKVNKVETKKKRRSRMQESAEIDKEKDKDKEAGLALDGDEEVAMVEEEEVTMVDETEEVVRVEETEAQEAAVPGLASDMGVEETAPRRPEEEEEEAKQSAPERQEEEEREAAPAPVE